MDRDLTIGQIARLSGLPARTIRYYEEVGVLPPPWRAESGYRVYSERDLRLLDLVRRARLLGIPLKEVGDLVRWARTHTCNDFQERFLEVVRRRRKEVAERIAELERLGRDLQEMETCLQTLKCPPEGPLTVLACPPETCRCLGEPRGRGEKGR